MWNSKKKAQLTILCRDLKLISRHEFPLFAPVQSRRCCFFCISDSLQLLGLMVATSFVVATLFARCFSKIDVATTVSCRNIIVLLFSWLLSSDLNFMSRPPFCLYDDFRSCCDFLFLVANVLVVFCLHRFQFYVATSR